jgi:hypothetical protein
MNPLEPESRKIISQYSCQPVNVDWTNVENNTTIFSLIIGLVQQAETQPVSSEEKKKLVLEQIGVASKAENSPLSLKQGIQTIGDKLSSLIDSIALSYQGKINISIESK